MTMCKESRTSLRFSGDHRIRRASRTCAATNCIWRRAASEFQPSIRPSRRCGFSFGSRSGATRSSSTHVIHEPRKLPVVLSVEEVARLLDAAPGLKYKAALSVSYGAGLRATEVVSLKVADIDSKRMIIRVEQGKGGKDRYVMLSPSLLDLLRAWWRAARPRGWLFPGRAPAQPMTTRQLNRACHAAAQMAEINKRVSPHTLRHSFATHLLEQKVYVRIVQVLLGHAKLETTALYTHSATKTLSEVMSPLEHIALKLKEIQPPN